jgi:hypothetical protein
MANTKSVPAVTPIRHPKRLHQVMMMTDRTSVFHPTHGVITGGRKPTRLKATVTRMKLSAGRPYSAACRQRRHFYLPPESLQVAISAHAVRIL